MSKLQKFMLHFAFCASLGFVGGSVISLIQAVSK